MVVGFILLLCLLPRPVVKIERWTEGESSEKEMSGEEFVFRFPDDADVGCGIVSGAPPSSSIPADTVRYVDLERYMGVWFEIASFPAWFQRGCYCTRAEYRLQGGYVEVINDCRRGSPEGRLDTVTGKAYVVPGTGNAQLKVQFFWPFKGDYWVVYLDDNYQVALVGHPDRSNLWVLGRQQVVSDEVYERLIGIAAEKGYDVQRLKKTQCLFSS